MRSHASHAWYFHVESATDPCYRSSPMGGAKRTGRGAARSGSNGFAATECTAVSRPRALGYALSSSCSHLRGYQADHVRSDFSTGYYVRSRTGHRMEGENAFSCRDRYPPSVLVPESVYELGHHFNPSTAPDTSIWRGSSTPHPSQFQSETALLYGSGRIILCN
jgi:hypothetical protein